MPPQFAFSLEFFQKAGAQDDELDAVVGENEVS